MRKIGFFLICLSAIAAATAFAADFQAEVTDVAGDAKLRRGKQVKNIAKGDLVEAEDDIEVASGGKLTLALDGDMQNVVLLTGPTNATVSSLYPTVFSLSSGDILSKLDALPEESAFQIETPAGIAAVRGSEFRTVYGSKGLEVFNLASSEVFLFNKELNGGLSQTPVVIPQSQKIEFRPGSAPPAARPISKDEMKSIHQMQGSVQSNIRRMSEPGRKPKLAPMSAIRESYKQSAAETSPQGSLISRPDGQLPEGRAGAFELQKKLLEKIENTAGPARARDVKANRPAAQPDAAQAGRSEEMPYPARVGTTGPQTGTGAPKDAGGGFAPLPKKKGEPFPELGRHDPKPPAETMGNFEQPFDVKETQQQPARRPGAPGRPAGDKRSGDNQGQKPSNQQAPKRAPRPNAG